MTKDALRKSYLEKRVALTDHATQEMSSLICQIFFASVDLSGVRVLHTFLPIKKNKEPDTFPVIRRILNEFPFIQLSIPKVNPENNELENYDWDGKEQLQKNKWGIPEPIGGTLTPVEKIDMVLVPLLVFDQRGNRIGYGKGFYDRFLRDCRSDCRRIGLSFFPPIELIDSSGQHDQMLDQVITPQKNYQF